MAEVNLRDPQYSLINRIGGGLNSLGQYLTADNQAAQQQADLRAAALSSYLANTQMGNPTIYDIPSAQAVPNQMAQNARPTAAIMPAAQVVANTTGQTAAEKEMSDYYQSLFPASAPAASLPLTQATVAPTTQAGTASPFSGSITPQVSSSAPVTVNPNGTTNFWKQNANPVRTWNSIQNVPEYSLGGQLLLASQLGMSPQQLMSGLDSIQARGITESPYWQDQYSQALQQTGDPNAALAHANLAATEAGQNTAGVFARNLAAPTQQASNLAADQAYGRTVLNPSAGNAYQNTLSTANTPVGATPAGNVLARTPDGNVTALPQGPYSAANASYLNSGAQAFQNALMREMAATPGTGVGTRGAAADPQYQALRNQQLQLRIDTGRAKLDAAAAKDPNLATAMRVVGTKALQGTPAYEQAQAIVESALSGSGAPTANTPPKLR